ncbi:flavin-containing monooxygenase [Pseudonocardia acaciae]|uniref:flavin-containing monooxygenase n=1 Tax=Pseudonocardia acaciae TaxID=551276 RepID=UPI000686CB65|nr:NAD(P)-binding domain-containing protein [Pseudonocardia acaciae]
MSLPEADPTDRYCVIGAGAAGLETLRTLTAAGIPVDCYERTDRVGGHWHTDYDFLHLITPRDASGFDGHPMPPEYPAFPSRRQVCDYLDGFAREHRLRERITFDTEVLGLDPIDDGAKGWRVRTSDGASTEYRGVIVCNGHLWSPRLPAEAAAFTGTSLHSGRYRNTGDIGGESVLVVGAGNSGCDIAVDAANAGYRTYISVRSGHVFQPKTFFGRPRGELPVLRRLPGWLQERVARALVTVSVGGHERYPGLPAPATRNLNRQPPVVNDLLLYWIQHGRITPVPGVSGAGGRTVNFTDGSRLDVDTVVWATGFEVAFPFLDDDLLRWQGGVPLRVGAMTLPVGRPGLYFVGLAAPRGGQNPVYSAQARLVARMISAQRRLDVPLCELFAAAEPPDARIDILRPLWFDQLARARKTLTTLERRASPGVPAQGKTFANQRKSRL